MEPKNDGWLLEIFLIIYPPLTSVQIFLINIFSSIFSFIKTSI